ncbi:acyltransferase [Rugosimonospora acidiphila]|uniref:Acyltransferase n=1 Tax=Rugosimonospora acidiphila TaxID=556531 RepID=A0ABP9RLM2_9ACTN
MRRETGAAARPNGRRLYEIDLLRFLAALAVLLFHVSYSPGQSEIDYAPVLGPVTRYGYLGVDLFFTISGLVVFMSLWGRSPRQFLASRISRLYPAFWVAVTLTTLVVVVVGARGRPGVGPVQYLANLTMFPQVGNVPYVEGVYWTLWSEWRFYALLFAFAMLGITVRRTHAFMWGWLVASLALEFVPPPGRIGSGIALIVQPFYCHYFIAGMALYLIHRSGATRNLVALLIACYANAVWQGVRNADQRALVDARLNGVVVAAIVTAIFVVMALAATGALRRWSRPGLAAVGLMTYPLYLIHPTLGFALLNALSPAVNRWVLLVGVIAALCALSWLISTQIEARVQPRMRTALAGARKPAPQARPRRLTVEPFVPEPLTPEPLTPEPLDAEPDAAGPIVTARRRLADDARGNP